MNTSYLKLNKPMVGSQGWGAAINQNFDKIDTEYSKMSSNLKLIESRIEETGTFSFLKYSYSDENGNTVEVDADTLLLQEFAVKIVTGDKVSYYKTPYTAIVKTSIDLGDSDEFNDEAEFNSFINNKANGSVVIGRVEGQGNDSTLDEFIPDDNQYSGIYYNDGDLNHTQFSSLPDFTAFYLKFPVIKIDNIDIPNDATVTYYAFGLNLNFDEILFKSSKIIDNQRQIAISKFKQVLGGYYQPSSTRGKPNTITFTKAQAAQGKDIIEIVIPRHVYNSVVTEINLTNDSSVSSVNDILTHDTGITKTNTIILPEDDTGEFTTYEQTISDIRFYTKNTTGPLEVQSSCIVGYDLYLNTESVWCFDIDSKYFNGENIYLSYSINSHSQENITVN